MAPSVNDREYDLVFKATQNWYDYAIAQGKSANPPSLNDTIDILLKKMTYYTATLAG